MSGASVVSLSHRMKDPIERKQTPLIKARSKVDFTKVELTNLVDSQIAYLIEIRKYVYQCQTQHIDRSGLKVIK